MKEDLGLADLGLEVDEKPKGKATKADTSVPKKALYRGKIEYAPPYYTLNIAYVEHMPDYEVIGVNGEVIQINRGEDVPNIPHAFVQVLKNSIASRQIKRRRASDQSEYFEWVPYPAIPYQIVAGPYNERKTPTED